MNKTVKIIALMIITGVFAISAYSQTDDSKPEKLVFEKINEPKSFDFLIKPDETKEVAIAEIKLVTPLHFAIGPAGKQEEPKNNTTPASTPTTPNQGGGTMGGVVPKVSGGVHLQSNGSNDSIARSSRATTRPRINWIVKKDGKEVANGSDEVTSTFIPGPNISTDYDYQKNFANLSETGTYTVFIKCVEKTACNYKLTLSLASSSKNPDPVNLEP